MTCAGRVLVNYKSLSFERDTLDPLLEMITTILGGNPERRQITALEQDRMIRLEFTSQQAAALLLALKWHRANTSPGNLLSEIVNTFGTCLSRIDPDSLKIYIECDAVIPDVLASILESFIDLSDNAGVVSDVCVDMIDYLCPPSDVVTVNVNYVHSFKRS